MKNEPHEMRLVRTTPSGSEEWHCPSCERRILMQWTPRYELLVMVAGDENVAHAGGRAGPPSGDPATDPPAAPETAPVPPLPKRPSDTYGVGPIQEIPRSTGPAAAKPEPAPEERRWLREIGIEWDND